VHWCSSAYTNWRGSAPSSRSPGAMNSPTALSSLSIPAMDERKRAGDQSCCGAMGESTRPSQAFACVSSASSLTLSAAVTLHSQPPSWVAQPQLLSQYRAAADDITTYTPLYSSAPLCFCLPASLLLGPWTRHSGLLSGSAASDAALQPCLRLYY